MSGFPKLKLLWKSKIEILQGYSQNRAIIIPSQGTIIFLSNPFYVSAHQRFCLNNGLYMNIESHSQLFYLFDYDLAIRFLLYFLNILWYTVGDMSRWYQLFDIVYKKEIKSSNTDFHISVIKTKGSQTLNNKILSDLNNFLGCNKVNSTSTFQLHSL